MTVAVMFRYSAAAGGGVSGAAGGARRRRGYAAASIQAIWLAAPIGDRLALAVWRDPSLNISRGYIHTIRNEGYIAANRLWKNINGQ